LQRAIEAKKAKDATFFDWLKVFEVNNPDAKNVDSTKIIEDRNDVIKWTKKIYDMNKHDRFMSLIKTEETERQFKEKMETTEEWVTKIRKQPHSDIFQDHKKINDDYKIHNYELSKNGNLATLVWYLSNKKKMDEYKNLYVYQRD